MLHNLKPDRKGAGILLLSLTWICLGLSVSTGLASDSARLPHTQLPLELRETFWFASAVVGLFAVWMKSLRGWALAALVIPVAIRVVSYFWAYLTALIPGEPPGEPRAWYSAAIHILMLGFVVYVAYEKDDRNELGDDDA